MHVPTSKKRPKYPSKFDITRTVAAARASGVDIAFIECLPNGAIRVGVDGALAKTPSDLFEQWSQAGQL